MKYDYAKATKRIVELRRKVIAQKDGDSVEGLSSLEISSKAKQQTSKTPKTQEIN